MIETRKIGLQSMVNGIKVLFLGKPTSDELESLLYPIFDIEIAEQEDSDHGSSNKNNSNKNDAIEILLVGKQTRLY